MYARYGRILRRFWKNSLIREMTFRVNFLLNVAGELIWIVLLLLFIRVIFSKTPDVRGWTEQQYLFLMGTHMIEQAPVVWMLWAETKRSSAGAYGTRMASRLSTTRCVTVLLTSIDADPLRRLRAAFG